MKNIRVSAAIIIREGKIFITQRGYGAYKDKWEFPGGKIEIGETPEMALIREIKEELDAEIRVDSSLCVVEYDYPEFHISMHCFLCSLVEDHLSLLEHEAAQFVYLSELEKLDLLPPDVIAVNSLKEHMKNS